VLTPLTAHNTKPSQLASEPVVPRMNRIKGDLTMQIAWRPSVSQPDLAPSLWPSRTTPSIHFRAALIWLAIFPLVATGLTAWARSRGLGPCAPRLRADTDRGAARRVLGRALAHESLRSISGA
jgi:hypothetical protein